MASGTRRIELSLATPADRAQIYAIRHQVYARELGQHPENLKRWLEDRLDAINTYIVAKVRGAVVGFVSVTPPTPLGYSIDKYFQRESLPFTVDGGVYEVRLLTVTERYRRGPLGSLLMYAAFRFVQSQGGRTIVAIGRVELLELYVRVGLRRLGRRARSGAVTYELMMADTRQLSGHLDSFQSVVKRLERRVVWKLEDIGHPQRPACYHGGAFFSAIGDTFDTLERKDAVINADVLDAWFDPAPAVLEKVRDHLAFAVKTSPPTHGEGLQRVIAAARGVGDGSILPGAGSSDLIFTAFQRWVIPSSRVLILNPMYGEYAHVLEIVIGAKVDRFRLSRARNYDVDDSAFAERIRHGYDLVVVVNPNSPTGRHVPRRVLERIIAEAPTGTRFWVDETYVDYVGSQHSLEQFAATSSNTVVCKSMSKAYALSGIRAAYLCGPPELIDELRPWCPPWSVSLPGQIAACQALKATKYYAARWRETGMLRTELRHGLERLAWEVLPGCANFLLCQLPADGPDAADVTKYARTLGLFLREVAGMGSTMDRYSLRVAVKDRATNTRMLEILNHVLHEHVAHHTESSTPAIAAPAR